MNFGNSFRIVARETYLKLGGSPLPPSFDGVENISISTRTTLPHPFQLDYISQWDLAAQLNIASMLRRVR